MEGILFNTCAVVIVEFILALIFVLIRGLSFKDLIKVVPISFVLNLLVFLCYNILSSMFLMTTVRAILGLLKLFVLIIEGFLYKRVNSEMGNGAFIVSGVLNVGSYLAFIFVLATYII